MYGEAFNVFCQGQLFGERQCHLQQQGSIRNAVLLATAFLLKLMLLKIKRDYSHQNEVQKFLQKEVKQTSSG